METQIKTTMGYNFTSSSLVLKKCEPLHTVDGNINWHSYYGKVLWFYERLNRFPYDPMILLLSVYPKMIDNICLCKNLHIKVHKIFIHNGKKVKATQIQLKNK
jgi:hypothetical protein